MPYYISVGASFVAFARLLEPPFRVLKHVPGGGALIEFGEDGIDALREATACLPGGVYIFDEQRRIYDISKGQFTLLKDTVSKGWRTKWRRGTIRRMRREARQKKKVSRMKARDIAVCAKLDRPACRKGRFSLLPGYRHYRYARPGGEGQYRFCFHKAKGKGKGPLPLFIFLHGMGSLGYNGVRSMLEFSHVWLGLLRGRQACHVLAPQLPFESEYDSDAYSETLTEVIGWVAETTGTLDRSRIYIAGISMGGQAMVAECRRQPERYAAAVACVGVYLFLLPGEMEAAYAKACYHPKPMEEILPALEQTPLWLAYSYRERDWNEPLYAALKERGADVCDTRIETFGHQMNALFYPFQHWAKWMFGKRKDAARKEDA
jgi:pimeloyl-ACP methyl ester carboxylesterase